ncbi:PREDICTED: uncharacterized protein LOC105366598 [Ceratosolen solmsi marchali]|uniref:Uncharacterized protein LOC105366598 n=1 Tax=Ceratosolen solmsi marchali TaxID=326594 RepID=A0AAJ7E0P9_9HYME|nr:PREDICTED: uncharacterized protein LOC105366598 [Ceratosolen solmsi marchali]
MVRWDKFKAYKAILTHKEYVESKLTSLKKYVQTLGVIMTWVMETHTKITTLRKLSQKESVKTIEKIMINVDDRQMDVIDVLENYTNLEKECEAAKQTVSIELQF